MFRKFSLLSRCLKCFESMTDEFFPVEGLEGGVVLFKVGLSRLATCTNSHGFIFIVVSRWACFKEMSASLINRSNQEANTKRSLGWIACLYLTLFSNFTNQSFSWMLAIMCVPIVHALSSHVFAEIPCISS